MDFSLLRRAPDVEGPGLVAADAADRLILDEAADLLATAPDGTVAVIDDAYGALALGAVDAGATDVRSHQDLITGERALLRNAEAMGAGADIRRLPSVADAVADARVVLVRLPRGLDRLAEVAALIAAHADADVTVVAGGRIKHMSVAMNDVLGEFFGRVDVSHARQKSRVLFARRPRARLADERARSWPQTRRDGDLGLTVAAHGGVFAGARVDVGTRFLLSVLDGARPDAATAVDLACGNGVVGAALARSRPGLTVLATDRSAAAVASARATAEANGLADRVLAVQADGLETTPDGTEEFVVLNPPFHSDAALSTGIAHHLFAEAARALRSGGELWCVWNSHLRYRRSLERIVGPTRQIARNPKFTVTASVAR